MLSTNLPSIKKIPWDACRQSFFAANVSLAEIIDALSPDDQYPFWQVEYPYGAVIDNGQFYYPTESGQLVLLDDARLSQELKNDFQYAGSETPAGIVLNNSIELFIETSDRVIPQALFQPGDVFGLWGRLDPQPIYHPSPLMSGTAGARSIFMIPNISDLTYHKKLRNDFNVKQRPPKNLLEQWSIFTALTNQSSECASWRCKVLLLSGKWIDKIKHDSAFRALYIYFLEQAWRNSAYWRNKVYYDFLVSCVQESRNLKPNPYLVDTMKYLMAIAIGATPGFVVSRNNIAAPIDYIQKVYVHSYGLKKYTPTLMHPGYFTLQTTSHPAYYSLQHPTTLEFSPRSRKISNTLYDLSELKHILDIFLHEVSMKRLKVEHGIMGNVAEEIAFDFFHSKPDRYGDIQLTKSMAVTDPALTQCHIDGASHQFADTGTFVRGCVRIARHD